MESMESFLNLSQVRTEEQTPESLAWRLLMDTDGDEADVKMCQGIMENFIIEDNELAKNQNVRYEQLSGQFEVLITMYMEMVISYLKFQHIQSLMNPEGEIDQSIDLEETFKPKYDKFTVDDLLIVFREKFAKIRIFLSIQEIQEYERHNRSSEYYCKVILKDTSEGKNYYQKNYSNPSVSQDKRYTFVLRNDVKKSNNKLDDFYAICTLPNMKIKISFSQLNVIMKN
jgi:hypothetical protein